MKQATFWLPFLHWLLVDAVGATTFSYSDPTPWCYWLPDVDVDQLGSSSIAGLFTANMGEGW